jgi:hypothetical protein
VEADAFVFLATDQFRAATATHLADDEDGVAVGGALAEVRPKPDRRRGRVDNTAGHSVAEKCEE